MITIKNTQRTIAIDKKFVTKIAETILAKLEYQDFDLGIWFTTNKTIRSYNKQYRNKDKATDILSFPYHQLKPGQRITVHCDEDKNIGDIIISLEFVTAALPLYKVSLEERLKTLLVHGVCHLLGYSHYDEENDKIMRKLETKLKKELP